MDQPVGWAQRKGNKMLDNSRHIIRMIRETDICRVDLFFENALYAYEEGRISWERIKRTLLSIEEDAPTENQGNGEHILQQTNGDAKSKS